MSCLTHVLLCCHGCRSGRPGLEKANGMDSNHPQAGTLTADRRSDLAFRIRSKLSVATTNLDCDPIICTNI